MSTHTLGTSTTTSIGHAITWVPGFNSGVAAADMATMCDLFKDDKTNGFPLQGRANWGNAPSGFSYEGLLYVPNRGVLKVISGDVIGVDSRGWPILLSKDTVANGNWVFT